MPEDLRERLLDSAEGLFAQLGYDQITNQMIADTAGVSVSEITRLIGGKRDVYLAVMMRVHGEEQAFLERAAAEFTPDAAGVHRFLDQYLDFFVVHPQTAALWMQRRFQDASDIPLEATYTYPQLILVAGLTADVIELDVDMELMLLTLVWCVHNFVQGGIPDPEGARITADDPAMLARFRAHLHRLVERMTGLPS
jgi:AcrR family transcriptional regulator